MSLRSGSERYFVAYQAGAIGLAIAACKILGFLRDIIIARSYGTGIAADAYYYVALLTNNVFVLFGGMGGPIDSSIVAVLANKDPVQRSNFASKVTSKTLLHVGALSLAVYLVIVLAIPWLASFYQPKSIELNASAEAKVQFANELMSQFTIMIPLIVLGPLLGILTGMARLRNKVLLPSLSPGISSLIMILVILPARRFGIMAGWPLAIGSTIGALLQVLVQIPGYRADRVPQSSSGVLDADNLVTNFKEMFLPALSGMILGYGLIVIDSSFAIGLGAGSWTAVSYSRRLIELPLGILGSAMLLSMFPKFASAASDSDTVTMQRDLHRCIRSISFVTLPISAIFCTLAEPIIRALFEGGQFTSASVHIVSRALTFVAPVMLFMIGRQLVAQIFWAFQDTVLPFKLTCVSIVLKIILDWLFVCGLKMDVAGISLATTCNTAITFTLLLFFLSKRMPLSLTRLFRPMSVMLIATTCSTLAAVTAHSSISHLLGSGKVSALCSLLGCTAIAGSVYVLVCWSMRLDEIGFFIAFARHSFLRQRKSAP